MSKGKAPNPKTVTIRPDHYDKVREKTHILYRCFNRKKMLLYIGITNHPEQRFLHHRQNKVWWKYVDRITLQSFQSRRILAEAEAAAIQVEKPKFNIQIPTGAAPEHPRTRGMARTLYPHASNFATLLPDHNFYLDQSIEQQLYPCVECHARAIYCEGETVACQLCSSEWSFEQWYAMTFEKGYNTPVGDQIPLL
jgi:predicted GIY-YIG superfamily endonuclease